MNEPTLDEQVRMVTDLIAGDPTACKAITTVTGVAILREAHPALDRRECLRLLLLDLARRSREAWAADQAMREDGWW